jgi:hypothetical protein
MPYDQASGGEGLCSTVLNSVPNSFENPVSSGQNCPQMFFLGYFWGLRSKSRIERIAAGDYFNSG